MPSKVQHKRSRNNFGFYSTVQHTLKLTSLEHTMRLLEGFRTQQIYSRSLPFGTGCTSNLTISLLITNKIPLSNDGHWLSSIPSMSPLPSGIYTVWSFAITLHKICNVFTKQVTDRKEYGLDTKPQGATFRVCEILERKLTEAFLQQLQNELPCSSAIWLHDGVWVSSEPSSVIIEAINHQVCRMFDIDDTPSLFRCTELQPETRAMTWSYRAINLLVDPIQ